MDAVLNRILQAALASHQSGRLEEADGHYRKLLRRAPLTPEALHNLGLLRHQRGDSAEAEHLIAKAIRLRPEAAAFYENLAAIQRSRGSLAAVIATCNAGRLRAPSPRLSALLLDALLDSGAPAQALALLAELETREPLTASRLADRAFCLTRLERIAEASIVAKRALAIDPATANAASTLAETTGLSGDHKGAARWWRRALRIIPEWPAARINLGLALLGSDDVSAALAVLTSIAMPRHDPLLAGVLLNGRSAAYRKLERRALALASLKSALAFVPNSAEYLNNLSELLRREKAMDALVVADRSLACDPQGAAGHNNKGLALEETDRLCEAVAYLRQALALKPNDFEFLNNIGSPLRWLGTFAEAEAAHLRSLAVNPSFAAGRYGLGTVQLTAGDLARGWPNYDWRFRGGTIVRPRPFSLPLWQGPEHTEPGPILIWGEQGLGDEIVYGTMLKDLERSGIPAIVECDARMVAVFKRALPNLEFFARTDPPNPRLLANDLVAQSSMGSLARWYRSDIKDFPRSGAHLKPRQDLVDHWRARLAELGDGPKVGFAWRSRRTDGVAQRFHPPVLEWAPVLAQAGATFVSLQYGECEPDLRAVQAKIGRTVHRIPDLDLLDDLEGILALSTALDMAISTGTTAFCLPAAAGIPVWLLAPENDFWVFGTDRYPWFHNIRLYRHRHLQPWASTIDRMGEDLRHFLRDRQSG